MLASLGLAACAGMAGVTADAPKEKKEALVAERAQARWNALIDKDFSGAYGYLTPATRQLVTVEEYKANFGGELRYTAARVEKVTCEAEACKVQMMVTYDHRLMKGITTAIEESWILDKGQFWYVYRG